MSVQYGVVLNKLTQPHSYMCQTVGRDTVEEKELAGFIHDKHPTITQEMAQTVLEAFGKITHEELLKGNGVTLTNFMQFYLTIRGKMKLPTDLIRKKNIQINAIPAKELQDDFRFIADIGPRIPIPLIKLPVITTIRDSNSDLPNWFRANHPMIVDGENLGIDRNDTDQGLFLTSPAGNVTEASLQLIGNKRLIGLPTLDNAPQPAGTNSVAYTVQTKTKYTPDGDLRSSNIYGYARTTNKVDESNPYVYVDGNASTSPATASYTGDAITVRLIATYKFDNILRVSAGLVDGDEGTEIVVSANGVYEIPIPGLSTGIVFTVTNVIMLVTSVSNHQRYIMEVLEIGGITPPAEVFIMDHYAYNSQYSTSTASRRGRTQRYSVLIGANIHVQFWQVLNEDIQFFSKVSIISINGNVVELDEGTPQAWDDPGSLEGNDFERSVFIKGGDSQIVCKYGGYFEILYRWTVNPTLKTLTLDENPIGLYPPTGYESPLECFAAALEYIPQNNKILALLQEDTAPNSTHAATLLYGSALTTVGDELWDQSVWFIEGDLYTQAWVGAYGGTKAVYAARLYDDSIYKVALYAVDTAGAAPTKIAELDYLLDSGDLRPVGIIGDPSNDQFILLTSGTLATAPLMAVLITQNGGVLTAGNSVELIPSGTEHYAVGAWIGNTVEVMAVTPGGFDEQVPVSIFTLNISGAEIVITDNWIDWENTNRLGMMSIHGSSTSQFIRTSIRLWVVTVMVDSIDSMAVVTDIVDGVQHEAAVTLLQYRHFRIQSAAAQTQVSVSVAGNPALWLIGRNTLPARENSGDEYSFDLSTPMVMAITGGEMIWLTLVGEEADPAATITATLS